ncbi:MAG: hypothetical protein ACI9EF_003221, partial [Pseudohongiellaceae bacterium]
AAKVALVAKVVADVVDQAVARVVVAAEAAQAVAKVVVAAEAAQVAARAVVAVAKSPKLPVVPPACFSLAGASLCLPTHSHDCPSR